MSEFEKLDLFNLDSWSALLESGAALVFKDLKIIAADSVFPKKR
jgi:hypothetical protein